MENVMNVALMGMVVLMVMFRDNGQRKSNQLVALGAGVAWLVSDSWESVTGLTGEYG